MLDRLPANAPRQQVLPDEYRKASDEELQQRISDAKQRLGSKPVVLGHFYQRDEIIKATPISWATPSSWPRTPPNARTPTSSCSPRATSMAETADILSTPEQSVTLPNCPPAARWPDMANIDQVQECWDQLGEIAAPSRTPMACSRSFRSPT